MWSRRKKKSPTLGQVLDELSDLPIVKHDDFRRLEAKLDVLLSVLHEAKYVEAKPSGRGGLTAAIRELTESHGLEPSTVKTAKHLSEVLSDAIYASASWDMEHLDELTGEVLGDLIDALRGWLQARPGKQNE